MKSSMLKEILSTALCLCAAVCVGYFYHRSKKGVFKVLELKHVFDWIDETLPQYKKDDSEKFEVNILPNEESQTLTKIKDKRVYVFVLQKLIDGDKKVITTKIVKAESIDADLSSLKQGNIVIIPIE